MNRTSKTALASLAGAAAIATIGAFASPTQAYRGDYAQQGPNCDSDRHEQMEQAFENNDYEAWKGLMDGRGRVSEVINADNFAQFAEAHRLAEEGNYDEADQIRQQLGLRTRNGEATGNGYGRGNGDGGGKGQGKEFGRGNK